MLVSDSETTMLSMETLWASWLCLSLLYGAQSVWWQYGETLAHPFPHTLHHFPINHQHFLADAICAHLCHIFWVGWHLVLQMLKTGIRNPWLGVFWTAAANLQTCRKTELLQDRGNYTCLLQYPTQCIAMWCDAKITLRAFHPDALQCIQWNRLLRMTNWIVHPPPQEAI